MRLAALVAVCLAWVVGCGSATDPGAASSPSTLPPTALVDLVDGSPVDLARYHGTPVIVNLWAPWCTPCRTEMPELQATQDRFGGRVQVVGITDDADHDEAVAAAETAGVTYPLLVDPDGGLQVDLAVTSLPATVFLGRDGEVLELHAGALDSATLDERIGQLYGLS